MLISEAIQTQVLGLLGLNIGHSKSFWSFLDTEIVLFVLTSDGDVKDVLRAGRGSFYLVLFQAYVLHLKGSQSDGLFVANSKLVAVVSIWVVCWDEGSRVVTP